MGSIGHAQWIGKRQRQEDALAVSQNGNKLAYLVLADGMGGHAGGDIASQLAVTSSMRVLMSDLENVVHSLEEAVVKSNDAIGNYIELNPENDGMGTTIVNVIIEDDLLYWSSVGDSHLYVIRDGQITKLNEDHSMAPILAKMAERGEISFEQAATDPKRHSLRSALIGGELDLVDLPQEPLRLFEGDIVLLCSDGVDTLPDVSNLIVTPTSAQGFADEVISRVEQVGYERQDNTSVIVYLHGGISRAQHSEVSQTSGVPSGSREIKIPRWAPVAVLLCALVLVLSVFIFKADPPSEEICAENSTTPKCARAHILNAHPYELQEKSNE